MMAAWLALLASHPAAALDQVSLQLKWKHQFQFAGYYAALEQGFYRDAGLDVIIREGGPGIDVAERVAGRKADFGACSASVLREWSAGRRLVVLAAIFQHSPAIILVARRADISSVSDLRGRTLMDTPGSDEIAAMLTREGVDYATMIRVPHDGNPRDLLAGRADAMVAYSTNEPFILEQLGAAYRTFSPADYGIDFYGDNLCTSEAEVKAHPDRVASFRAASIKGWAYALANKQATADLILKSYSDKKSREALLFEAEHTEILVGRDPDRIGEQDAARWRRIAATYQKLGLLTDTRLPNALIYDGDDGSSRRWLIPLLLVAAGLAVVAAVAYRNRRSLRGTMVRRGALRLLGRMGRPRLSLIMSLLFIGLSIPILIFILIYNYNKNSAGMVSILNEAVAQTSRAGVERTQDLIENTESPLRFLAELASADPGYFRTEQSRDLLYRALTSAAYIDAAYVSFEDGYHRVVTRIDEDRRRADARIPPTANWHSSYIDAITYALSRVRHRKFFDIWPHEVGAYDVATDTDIRTLPGYQAAKTTRTLAVTEPSINPDTGFPVVSLRVPVFRGVEFLGCASANITVDVLSRFFDKHRASARSTTFVADRSNGKIIAFPDKQKGVRIDNGVLKIATLADIDDPEVREAHRQHARTGADSFVFQSPANGEDLIAAFANFPGGFGQPWQVITLTPIDDFVGTLKATNRLMMIVIIVLTMVELFFIYFASRRLSRPVENVSRQLQAIEGLNFDTPARPPSNIQEIARLESAASLLRNVIEIILLLRSARRSPPAYQIGHSADPRRRAAIPHGVLFRPGEFFHALRDARAERSAGADLDLSRTGVGRDIARGRHGRQIHRRRRHGVLECSGSTPRPRAARLRRRVAGGPAHGAGQRYLGGGRAAANQHQDRAQLRQCPGRQCRIVGAAQLHRVRRRRQRCRPPRRHQQAVRHHDLHQRQHLRAGAGGHPGAAAEAGSGQGPQDRVHDLRITGASRQRRSGAEGPRSR